MRPRAVLTALFKQGYVRSGSKIEKPEKLTSGALTSFWKVSFEALLSRSAGIAMSILGQKHV